MNIDDFRENWKVSINEVSMGIYRILAIHTYGPSIDLTGEDVDLLINNCRNAMITMEEEIEKKRRS